MQDPPQPAESKIDALRKLGMRAEIAPYLSIRLEHFVIVRLDFNNGIRIPAILVNAKYPPRPEPENRGIQKEQKPGLPFCKPFLRERQKWTGILIFYPVIFVEKWIHKAVPLSFTLVPPAYRGSVTR